MNKQPQKKVIILKSITTDIDLSEKHYEPLSIWVVPNFGLAHGLEVAAEVMFSPVRVCVWVYEPYIPYVDQRTKNDKTLQELETLCELTHVHTRFSRIRKSKFTQKGSILVCCYLSQNGVEY